MKKRFGDGEQKGDDVSLADKGEAIDVNTASEEKAED